MRILSRLAAAANKTLAAWSAQQAFKAINEILKLAQSSIPNTNCRQLPDRQQQQVHKQFQ